MSLAGLPGLLSSEAGLSELLGSDDSVVAVGEAARPFVLAALAETGSAPVVLVATATAREAENLTHDLAAFSPEGFVELLPAWETLPFERVSPAVETMGRRLRAMWHLRHATSNEAGPRILVSPVRALLQRLGPRVEDVEPVVVSVGEEVELSALTERLALAGYRREYQVEHRGEMAIRGGIIDVFPSTGDSAVRLDLFGDVVERLSSFDVGDQRSTGELGSVELFGCREVVLTPEVKERARELSKSAPLARDAFERIAEGLVFEGMESWLPWLTGTERLFTDLLSEDSRVVLLDPRRLRARAEELIEEEESLADALVATWAPEASEKKVSAKDAPRLHLGFERLLSRSPARLSSLLAPAESPEVTRIESTGWPPVMGDPSGLLARLRELVTKRFSVVMAADGSGSAERIRAVLDENGFDVDEASEKDPEALRRPGLHVAIAQLDKGAIFPGSRLAVVAEADLTGRKRPHRAARPRARPTEGFFDDLEPGCYVVHEVHGVARYGGLVRRKLGDTERDYLLLEYRGSDKLYIPSDQIAAITPYSGGEQPSLSRLGGSDWQRQKARARAATREIARELVELYRRRATTEGHAFSLDTPWQHELEQSFPYPETVDQLKATADVKADMEQSLPMDRLVCGDVGFGKTEVAVRAVFKAVQDGYQAAVLVPTTLLASQHLQTFSERFSAFPIRVEMLSRFVTPGAARKVANDLADGSVDVVIGTHRLLGSDVKFRKLGLLVVDEEQRFGVSHKESIKMLTAGVDVLTLTANPIPRTLEMSLTGIRELSLISTPPAERLPILTYVGEYDDRAVTEAIRRELLREGQVFYVHNRVFDIDKVAEHVRSLAPDARVAVAHGQMDEGSLEKVVIDFWEGRLDVLVSTTIIESGIDMPAVNTMVVDRADMLGLGQLHQLRGRVGRGDRRAYAYLLYPPDRSLSEQAYERLKTIGEQTELGSGFKIAMRDLEIRGAGNLLGADQSGHIAAVGYDLYVRMVQEAVSELKGERAERPPEVKIDLPVRAHLPEDYVGREDLRLEAYRRLANVTDDASVADISSEWLDRYGPLPKEADALLSVGRLRAFCVRQKVSEVTGSLAGAPAPGSPARRGEVLVRVSPFHLLVSGELRLRRLAPRAIYKPEQSLLIVPLAPGEEIARRVVELLSELVGEEGATGPPAQSARSIGRS